MTEDEWFESLSADHRSLVNEYGAPKFKQAKSVVGFDTATLSAFLAADRRRDQQELFKKDG